MQAYQKTVKPEAWEICVLIPSLFRCLISSECQPVLSSVNLMKWETYCLFLFLPIQENENELPFICIFKPTTFSVILLCRIVVTLVLKLPVKPLLNTEDTVSWGFLCGDGQVSASILCVPLVAPRLKTLGLEVSSSISSGSIWETFVVEW